MKQRALLICPVHPVRQQLIEVVLQSGATHVVTSSVREATKALKDGKYDIIVTGRKLDDGNAEDLLQAAKAAQPGVPVVVVSRTGDWNEYIDAINRGAFDLLAADSPSSESTRIISNALRAAAGSRAAAVESGDKRGSGRS
jgi:DNA-binding NtrC family response regulator